MKNSYTTSVGINCSYDDENIIVIVKSDQSDVEHIFPYGSITSIKVNLLGLHIDAQKHSCFVPLIGRDKPWFKEMVSFAKKKMRTAEPTKSQYINYRTLREEFYDRYADERKFYEACKKAGVILNKESTKADIMRAMLIANENNLPIREERVVSSYLIGQKHIQTMSEHTKYEALYSYAKSLERYASYHGREKEVQMSADMLKYYTMQKDYLCTGKAIPFEQETDWAILGGIASAIAGGAAGVVVASNAQAKNAEIRERNAQVWKQYTRVMLPKITEAMENVSRWQKRYDKAKISLVDDSTGNNLLKHITISEANAYVLYDGSFVVTVKARNNPVTIYDTVKARIDGSITAVVYQDGYILEEVPLIIPEDATHGFSYLMVGASSTRDAVSEKPLEVQFKYRDLWAIEE